MREQFREQLIDLWHGKTFQQREIVNYSLNGDELHLHLQFSVLPGHEHDWSLVQVALTDITARKKAEAYLEYLGKHDVLTKLYNRTFYADELNRLERKGPFPVTVIVVDLNGLKAVNTVASNPLFVGYSRTAATPNYKLTTSSPAIGRGVATYASAMDIDGKPRNATTGYDIGAYQH